MSKSASIISKNSMRLSKLYENYLAEKHDYLNHKRVVEYLFNKPLVKISTVNDLLLVVDDSSVNLVRLERNDSMQLDSHLLPMNKYLTDYSDTYDSYKKYIKFYEQQHNKPFNKLLKINYLPLMSDLNLYEKSIVEILGRINKVMEDKFNYTYKWNFMVEGEHTSLMKLPTVNYQQSFVYDFYGITMWHSQLVHFVILFDDDSHFDSSFDNFEKIHGDDILKQHILFQMNVHLLRLNARSDLKVEILSFVKQIRSSTKYISKGKIKPIARLFQSSKLNKKFIKELSLFKQDYEHNHKIYLKTPAKKNLNYDSDDDDFFYHQSIKDNYSEVPIDDGTIVSTDVINQILRFKKDFHPPKQTANEKKAENIIVELKRNNGYDLSDEKANDNVLDDEEAAAILKFVFDK